MYRQMWIVGSSGGWNTGCSSNMAMAHLVMAKMTAYLLGHALMSSIYKRSRQNNAIRKIYRAENQGVFGGENTKMSQIDTERDWPSREDHARLSGRRTTVCGLVTCPSCAGPLQPLVGWLTANGARRSCNPSTGHRIFVPGTAPLSV